MWQELVLVHREAAKDCIPLVGKGSLWRTCLREILFLDPGSDCSLNLPEAQVIRGSSAHRFLIEICSGLRSPLFGETEVLGQFRAFREKHSFHPLWESLFDAADEDVRKLRRSFLTGMGSQSYGSLARRHLPKGSRVVLVGAGRLACDLLPWLGECSVLLAARNLAKAVELPVGGVVSMAALNLSQEHLAGASWLLAAPIANADLLRWWEKNPARLVLDFRGESQFSALPAHCARYFSLQDLYKELESAKERHESKRLEALAFARELSERREHSVTHRPFGWEDAFA